MNCFLVELDSESGVTKGLKGGRRADQERQLLGGDEAIRHPLPQEHEIHGQGVRGNSPTREKLACPMFVGIYFECKKK